MIRIRGRNRQSSRQMNRTEQAYADYLYAQKLAGDIAEFWYEALKFRLADRTWYTPDFVVMDADGYLEIHECKKQWRNRDTAHWEDDARVKIKVVAEMFPQFRWIAVHRDRGGWQVEEFNGRSTNHD